MAQIEAQEQCLEVVDSDKATDPCESNESRLVELANDIRTRMKRSAIDIYYIGVNLLEAAQLLPHGAFMRWIESEFEMSWSVAYKFINVAKANECKFVNFTNLEITARHSSIWPHPLLPQKRVMRQSTGR